MSPPQAPSPVSTWPGNGSPPATDAPRPVDSDPLDDDALPEGDPVGDLLGGVLRLGVVPGGIIIALAVHHHAPVARRALPRAHRRGGTRLEVLLVDGGRRKVVVPLHHHCLLYTSPSPRDRTRSRMPSS